METMNEIGLFASAQTSFFPSLLITLFGITIYWFVRIMGGRRVKKFNEIKLGLWWNENQVNFVLNVFVCIAIFIASWFAGTLTIERCFCLGFIGQFVTDKFLNYTYKWPN